MNKRRRLVVGSACLVASVMVFGAACTAKNAPPKAPPAVPEAATSAPLEAAPGAATPTAAPTAVPTATAAAPAATSPASPAPAASQDKPYTQESPGPWDAAVAAKHSPEITYAKAGKGLTVTVKVDHHPMDAQKPHYIVWIKLEDAQGKELGKKDFVATDPAPTTTFELAAVPATLKALEQCNVHGTWASSVAVAVR
jgi:desulfoferrodoxin (superoxide reductase-like protein)